jgi:hypothetical protein
MEKKDLKEKPLGDVTYYEKFIKLNNELKIK